MATVTTSAPAHRRSGWIIAEGIVLIILGIIALAAPVMTTAAVGLTLPVLLLVEGIVLIVSAFGERTFGSAAWHVVLGLIALAGSAALFVRPYLAIASVPVILGLYLLLKGISQFAIGVSTTGGKAAIFASAVINVLLGILVFSQPAGASLVLTGIYIGVSIFMLGLLLLVAPTRQSRGERAM